MDLSRNKGGIQRGDSEETGDLEARPTDGVGPTELNGDSDLEDLTIHGASDPDLGLTDIGDIPADDWAADTGPTRTGESSSHAVDAQLADNDRDPSGRTIDLQPAKRKKKK